MTYLILALTSTDIRRYGRKFIYPKGIKYGQIFGRRLPVLAVSYADFRIDGSVCLIGSDIELDPEQIIGIWDDNTGFKRNPNADIFYDHAISHALWLTPSNSTELVVEGGITEGALVF